MASASWRPPLRAMRSESKISVLMKVFHGERGDFRAAKTHLQAHRENRAVAQAFDSVFSRCIQQLRGIGF
jgi:hypothetical protein